MAFGLGKKRRYTFFFVSSIVLAALLAFSFIGNAAVTYLWRHQAALCDGLMALSAVGFLLSALMLITFSFCICQALRRRRAIKEGRKRGRGSGFGFVDPELEEIEMQRRLSATHGSLLREAAGDDGSHGPDGVEEKGDAYGAEETETGKVGRERRASSFTRTQLQVRKARSRLLHCIVTYPLCCERRVVENGRLGPKRSKHLKRCSYVWFALLGLLGLIFAVLPWVGLGFVVSWRSAAVDESVSLALDGVSISPYIHVLACSSPFASTMAFPVPYVLVLVAGVA